MSHLGERLGRVRRFVVSLARMPSNEALAADARGQERMRRIAFSSISGWGLNGVTVAASTVIVPLLLRLLGAEQYGLWLALSALVAPLRLSDLGMGNSIISTVAKALGRGDRGQAVRVVSSVFYLEIAISLALLLAAFFAIGSPLAERLLAVDDHRGLLYLVSASMVARVPTATIASLRRAMQCAYVSDAIGIAGQVARVGLVLLVTWLRPANVLFWVFLILCALPLMVNLVDWGVLLRSGSAWARPRLSTFSWPEAKRMAGSGFQFVGLQLATFLGWESIPLLIGQYLGTGRVPEFSVPLQLFMFGTMAAGVALQALWPAYADAIARGDGEWARRAYEKTLLLGLAVAVPYELLVVLFSPAILSLWTGTDFHLGIAYRAALAAACLVMLVMNVNSKLLRGAEQIPFELATFGASSVVVFAAMLIAIPRWGIFGALVCVVGGYLLLAAVPMTLKVKSLLSSFRGQETR